MKKYISFFVVLCFLASILPVQVCAEETEDTASKQLTQITINQNGDVGEYYFSYNSSGLLESVKHISFSGYSSTTNYIYDEEGRYIQYESNGKVYDEYKYDTSGILISYKRYGDHWWDYTYYYDQGVLRSAKCVDVMGGETEITYETNDQNKVVKENKRELMYDGSYRTTTCTYLYDDVGRKIQETYKYPEGSNVTIKYDYSKKPFVYNGSDLWIEDKMGHMIWGLLSNDYHPGDITVKTDEDGYVTSAISDYDGRTWEFVYEESTSEYNFQIYSPHQELTVDKDKYLQIICTLNNGNKKISDWEQPSISVGNAGVLTYVTCDKVDTGYCITLKGVSPGTSTLMIRDDETGTEMAVLMHVSDEQSSEYKYVLGMVPIFYPDTFGDGKIKTNFFNYNGLYVTGLENEVESVDGFYELNFNVYNTSYMHGSVDVYDASHEWIESVRIDKNANVGDAWDALEDGFYLLCDLIELNGSFTASFASTETNVRIKVPEGGYFVISNNIRESPGACMYNCLDLVVWSAGKITGVALNEKGTKDFQDMVIEDIIRDPEFIDMCYDKIISSVEGYAIEVSGNSLKANYIDIAGNFTNHTIDILAELDIDINKIYSDIAGKSVDLLVKLLPKEVQVAYDLMFGVSEYTDLVGQIHDMCTCFVLDKPCVKIFTPQYTEKISFIDRITNFLKKTS